MQRYQLIEIIDKHTSNLIPREIIFMIIEYVSSMIIEQILYSNYTHLPIPDTHITPNILSSVLQNYDSIRSYYCNSHGGHTGNMIVPPLEMFSKKNHIIISKNNVMYNIHIKCPTCMYYDSFGVVELECQNGVVKLRPWMDIANMEYIIY